MHDSWVRFVSPNHNQESRALLSRSRWLVSTDARSPFVLQRRVDHLVGPFPFDILIFYVMCFSSEAQSLGQRRGAIVTGVQPRRHAVSIEVVKAHLHRDLSRPRGVPTPTNLGEKDVPHFARPVRGVADAEADFTQELATGHDSQVGPLPLGGQTGPEALLEVGAKFLAVEDVLVEVAHHLGQAKKPCMIDEISLSQRSKFEVTGNDGQRKC